MRFISIDPMFLGINSDIKNLEELEERYQKNLKRCPSFSAINIRDHLINIYYKCCIEEDMSVDEFMNYFKVKEDKDKFVERATNAICLPFEKFLLVHDCPAKSIFLD